MITQLRLHAVVFDTIFSCVKCDAPLHLLWTPRGPLPITLECSRCAETHEVHAQLDVYPTNGPMELKANAPARAKEAP